MVSARLSWREELRQDRLVDAQIDRDREAARTQLRIADRQARARERREADQARSAARQQARDQRAARQAARMAWVRRHVTGLLFVPVIAVPGVLAWTAMAAYGSALYGPAGLALPAFSEGAMWAFAAATTITRRRHPDRPVWHLRLGIAVFAAYGAALNFAHGIAPAGPGPHGPVTGVVMALVSVAGVTAHQLITAGPRRSRAERDQARITRIATRRQLAVRKAAARAAVADLGSDGRARLIYQPGQVTVTRQHGRARLEPVPALAPPLVPAGQPEQAPPPDPGQDRRTEPDADRTEGRTGDDSGPRGEVDRAAIVAELADQIRDAIEAGDRWQPDYPALIQRTGFRRSWCEKAVRDARTAAFRTAVTPPARTDPGPDGQTRTARPALHAIEASAG
jgi:hypothetical protein